MNTGGTIFPPYLSVSYSEWSATDQQLSVSIKLAPVYQYNERLLLTICLYRGEIMYVCMYIHTVHLDLSFLSFFSNRVLTPLCSR